MPHGQRCDAPDREDPEAVFRKISGDLKTNVLFLQMDELSF